MAIFTKQPGSVPMGRPYSLGQYLAENGKVYQVTSGVVTVSAAAQTDFALIKNPTGSGKVLRLNVSILTISAVNKSSFFRFYRNPTTTSNGTALSIFNRKQGGAATAMQAFHTPTISSRGNLFEVKNVGTSALVNNFNLELMINAGDSILVTAEPSSTNIPHAVSFVWAEVDPTTLI